MIDPRLATMTTLDQAAVNPLAAPSLAQGTPGLAQIPTGTVETRYEPTTERKIMGGQTKAAVGALDSAYDDEVKALQAKKDADVQKEGFSQQGAKAQADVAQKKETALSNLEKQREDWRIKREAEREREFDDFMKSQKSTTVGNIEPIRQLVSALAVGMGGYAAAMNGGPNTAWEIFKTAEDNARKAEEAKLKQHVERMAASGKNAEEMLKYFSQQHDAIEKLYGARNDVALKKMEALKATVPSAAAAADEAIAKAEQRKAEGKRNFITAYDETVREPGTTTQTSSGGKNMTDPAAHETSDQRTMALYAANMRREIKKMKELPPISEEGLRKYQDNETQMYAAAEEAKTLSGAAKVVALRRLEALTRSKFEGVKEDDAVSINGMESANEAFRRVLSGANIQEKEKADLLSQNQIQPGDSQKLREAKLQRMDEITEDFMTLSGNAGKRLSEATAARAQANSRKTPIPPKPKAQSRGDARSDYDFIKGKLDEDPNALGDRIAAWEEAIKLQRSADPKERAKAARGFKILRDELPKD